MIYDDTIPQDDRIEATFEIDDKMSNFEYINELMDFYAENNIFLDIKTCQKLKNTGREKYPTRKGHFVIDFEKHKQLVLNQGFYLFIVFDDGHIIRWRMVSASDLYYQERLMWDRLFKE